MKLSIAADHAGFLLKQALIPVLESRSHQITDHGTHSEDSMDYPDVAHPLAESVASGKTELGILICGSANGVAMSANKHAGIRAAICWKTEIASLARQHNNANVLCLPARFISTEEAIAICEVFLSTAFEGGRHQRRVEKIAC